MIGREFDADELDGGSAVDSAESMTWIPAGTMRSITGCSRG